MCAGKVERSPKAGPVELGAGGAVFVVDDDPPVLLQVADRSADAARDTTS